MSDPTKVSTPVEEMTTEEKRDQAMKQLKELAQSHNQLNQGIVDATARRENMRLEISRLQGAVDAYNSVIGPAIHAPVPEEPIPAVPDDKKT